MTAHARQSGVHRRRRAAYSPAKAGAFWTKRLASTNPLAAVLTYNAPAAINAAYDRWERAALSAAIGQSLRRTQAVDLGAGTGRISLLLAAKGARVTSIDISDGMLNQLMRFARSKKLARSITPVHANVTNIPCADKSADLVTCCGLLEHLPASARSKALSEAFRILKPSGKLLVVVNNVECVFLAHRYGMKSQRADGYFVGLVGLPWLAKRARQDGWIVRVRAANPWYACAYYLTMGRVKSNNGPKMLQSELSQLTGLDATADPESPIVQRLASHYLVEVTRR